jgi:hypothetical protein
MKHDIDTRKVALCLILSGVLGTSACSMQAGKGALSGESGRILIDADEKGMRAFSDLVTGSITTGKASPDQDTAHHQMRKVQSQVEMTRFTSKSFSRKGGE